MFLTTLLVVIVGLLAPSLGQTTHSRQVSTPQDDSYVAAVLEYNLSTNTTVNLAAYLGYIREAAAQNADIVVFPELCLNRGDPVQVLDPRRNPMMTPAEMPHNFDHVLVAISQAAIASRIYVVVNVEELLDCLHGAPDEECPGSQEYLFNTNVVFDRTGTIIDRYRKINLFGEFTRTPALTPDLGVFATDFGVTFGHFICFDLMFQVPAVQVVQKLNVTDVVFTTMWFSETPYLTAVQIQEAFAYAMDVNFLASGANNVRAGSGGSGIYSGKAGALISTMPGLPTSRLLVSRVPKVPGRLNGTYPGPIVDPPREADTLFLKPDPSLSAHVSRLLQPGFQEFSLTHNEVTCQFRIRMTARGDGVGPYFRAFVQDGANTYVRRELAVAACSVVACRTNEAKSCANRYDGAHVNIEELEIQMTSYATQFNASLGCENIVYFASTLQNNKFPLHPSDYTFSDRLSNGLDSSGVGRGTISLKLNAAQESLVTFGIWGRVYTKDVDHSTVVTEDDIVEYMEHEDAIFEKSRPNEKKVNREQ